MALAANSPRTIAGPVVYARYPMNTSIAVYAGSAVCVDTSAADGGILPLTDAADREFAGFSTEFSAGATVFGDTYLEVCVQGIIEMANTAITDADPEDVGNTVYMSDDDTFTMAAGANPGTGIGTLLSVDETHGVAQVFFQGFGMRSV